MSQESAGNLSRRIFLGAATAAPVAMAVQRASGQNASPTDQFDIVVAGRGTQQPGVRGVPGQGRI